jgi:hypothetical protein
MLCCDAMRCGRPLFAGYALLTCDAMWCGGGASVGVCMCVMDDGFVDLDCLLACVIKKHAHGFKFPSASCIRAVLRCCWCLCVCIYLAVLACMPRGDGRADREGGKGRVHVCMRVCLSA